MPKVIQFIKSKLGLHRGKKLYTSDPYKHGSKLKAKARRGLNWTLDSFHLSPRCSRTFSSSREGLAKETNKKSDMKTGPALGRKGMGLNNSISRAKNLRLVGGFAAVSLLLLVLLTISPVVIKLGTAEGATGTSVAADTILTMSSGFTSANLSLSVADSTGTFASSTATESAKFNVATNNYTGYTLSISASDDNGLLTNTDASITTNNTLSSIPSAINADTFDNPTYNGKWGYKPSKYNSTANTDTFYPAPTTTASTLDATNTPNTKKSGATGDTVDCTNYDCNEYTIALGARADYNKPAGTYTNTFIISAVSNPIAYSITYADNTGDSTVANLPSFGSTTNHTQSGSTATAGITLSSTIPTRTGYEFKAWCLGTVSNSSPHIGTVCTGTEFIKGAEYGLDQTVGNTATLYATWTPSKYTIIIKSTTGLTKVSLNGTECTDTTNGCSVNNLVYNQTYNLVATVGTGYTFSSWSKTGQGTIASTSATSTAFTVGAGTATITPATTINKYTCTKRYRLQDADGNYPSSYTADGTEQVNYGATCTYSKTVTDYNSNTSKSGTCTMTTSGCTVNLDLPRNTYVLTVNKNNSYISSVTGAGTYRWGQSVSISATASTGNEFITWSQTAGTGQGTTNNFASATTASTTFTMPKSAATIYAEGKSSTKTIATATYMQDVSSKANGGCPSTLTTGQAYELTDSRDSQKYYVARLADGNCWLLDNLRLGVTNIAVDLTSSNTNLSTTIPKAAWNGYRKTSGFDSYTTPMFNSASANSTQSYGSGSGKIGVYYNYCAASAGTYCYAEGSGVDVSGTIIDAPYDVCPKGWRMPTGGASGEYRDLYTAYSSNATNFKNALRTPLSGRFYDSSVNNLGINGRFWSSTYIDGNIMGYLEVHSADVYPARGGGRYYGHPVRCVLK